MSVDLQERNSLQRRQQLERRRKLRRRRRRQLFIRLSAVILIAAVLITGAVILISRLINRDNSARYAEIQEEITALPWVTQDLLPINDYSRPGIALSKVNAIVIHYVGNPNTTAAQNRSFYNNLAETHETSASSNFLVGLDGEILQCVPVNEVAYCSNWRNDDTLSIECCHPDETGQFNADTYDALVRLVAWLCREFKLTSDDLIRHYDITGKECPKYFVDYPDSWEAFKADVQIALDALKKEQ